MKYGLDFNFLSKFVQKCNPLKKNNDLAGPGSFFFLKTTLVDKVHILGGDNKFFKKSPTFKRKICIKV